MRHYTQLTEGQRYQISALKDKGFSQTEIAASIGVHKSTISRELKRNTGKRGYRPKQAHRLAIQRAKERNHRRLKAYYWSIVEFFIKQDWSPKQISLRLAQEGILQVSHEKIYQYIYADKHKGGLLYKHLRRKKKYRNRQNSYDKRGKIANRVSIAERPAIVDLKQRGGDWELDTVIGKNHQQALVTLVERKTKTTFIKKVEKRDAASVGNAIIELLKPYSRLGLVHTLTADNGKEFADHQRVAQQLEADFYFADPYASWQRGLNENTNGLIRQYCPKGSSFDHIDEVFTEEIMFKLNNRPRETLGMQTPNEVMLQELQGVALRD